MGSNESNTSDNDEPSWGGNHFNDKAGRVIDSEALIRRSFETDHLKGCALLFKRYYQPLCSHAVRFVYSRAIAEDIVMEVFSRFWQNKTYQLVNTSYRAYLFTTVRNAAFAYLKTEFGKELPDEQPIWDASQELVQPSTPHQLLQYHELNDKIEQILKTIPPQGQKVFIMSRFDGKKNQAIADELNLSVKTVEGHITKAISIFRRSLRESGFITSVAVIIGITWVISRVQELFFSLLILSQL